MAGNSWLGINVRWLCGLIATTIGVVALSNSACAALIAEEPFAIGARNQRSVFKTVNLVKTVKTVKTVNLAHKFFMAVANLPANLHEVLHVRLQVDLPAIFQLPSSTICRTTSVSLRP
jgi:hypothetical protein